MRAQKALFLRRFFLTQAYFALNLFPDLKSNFPGERLRDGAHSEWQLLPGALSSECSKRVRSSRQTFRDSHLCTLSYAPVLTCDPHVEGFTDQEKENGTRINPNDSERAGAGAPPSRPLTSAELERGEGS